MFSERLRPDGRALDEIRPVHFHLDYVDYPEGSVLVEMGKTRVLCNATIEDGVPSWMSGQGKGWLTAEYAMLPRATHTRTRRETQGFSGRTQEIRRLIGRALRMAVDLEQLEERTILLDCDVIQADGGTRTAAITGSYVALALALRQLIAQEGLPVTVLKQPVAAVSVGVIGGDICLDLCYQEDSRADIDMNMVMTADGKIIELQGTAEREAYPRKVYESMMNLAEKGIENLCLLQKQALG